jgi:hypothetical protein
MEKSKKILVFVGIGLLAAIGIYVGVKYANANKKGTTQEEEEPKLVIDEVLDFGDGTVGVQYTFGEVVSSYDTFGKQQNIKPKKNSIYSLQIDTITDPDLEIDFNLFKNGKFLKTLKRI